VAAGCQPVRVAVSPDGRTVWVTALQSDALLGFSAAGLLGDPSRALQAVVRVGADRALRRAGSGFSGARTTLRSG